MPTTKKEPPRFSIHLAPEKRRKLKIVAAVRGTTMRALVEQYVDKMIEETPVASLTSDEKAAYQTEDKG